MSAKASKKVSYRWHLRVRMAERGMYATSDLVPLLAERGVVLSREQVYRLVAQVPERLSLTTLAALCDALELSPGDLVEPVRPGPKTAPAKTTSTRGVVQGIRPQRARVAREE
jgi:DNA-binding Xre family transcriptional regulator